MDVSKYHAKCPPREHEEAVRMLLEGLDRQLAQSDLNKPGKSKESRRGRVEDAGEHDIQEAPGTKQRQQHRPPTNSRAVKSDHAVSQQAASATSSVDSGSLARCPYDDDEVDDDHEETRELARANLSQRKLRSDRIDDLEFNSEDSSSHESSIQVSPQIPSKRDHALARTKPHLDSQAELSRAFSPKMQSKATSTASDSLSTSGASSASQNGRQNGLANSTTTREDDDIANGSYEAIPSRTIAIQCDLRLSSVKRDTCLDSASTDLASMQASSISSTRYGFYKLSPDTLEQRRQLARSVSSRNIAHHADSEPPLGAPARSTEAPTSLSELSASDDERPPVASGDQTMRSNNPSSIDGSDLARARRDHRFFSQRQQQQRTSAARTRQDSLPRRPKTALSYVSTSRLCDDHGGSDDNDDNEDQSVPDMSLSDHEHDDHLQSIVANRRRVMPPRSRAISQQVLSAPSQVRRRTSTLRAHPKMALSQSQDLASHSNSDGGRLENLQAALNQRGLRTHQHHQHDQRGASPQVRRSNNIRGGPLLKRLIAPTTTDSQVPHRRANYLDDDDHGDVIEQPRQVRQENTENSMVYREEAPESELTHRRMRHRVLGDSSTQINNSSAYYSTTTDEENQLASSAGTRRRHKAATLTATEHLQAEQPSKARFSSASLSRNPLINQERGSCNLAGSGGAKQTARPTRATRATITETNTVADYTTDGSAAAAFEQANYYSNQEQHRSTLTRKDRLAAGRQQAMPARRLATLTAADTLGGELRATSQPRAQIGRSISMKHGRTRPMPDGLDPSPSVAYTTPDGGNPISHRQRGLYEPSGTRHCGGQYDDCCGPADEHNEAHAPARTWANPSVARRQTGTDRSHHQSVYNLNDDSSLRVNHNDEDDDVDYRRRRAPNVIASKPLSRKSARSHSMRDLPNQMDVASGLKGPGRRFESIYRAGQQLDNDEDEPAYRQSCEYVVAASTGCHPDDEELSVCSTSSLNGAASRVEMLSRAAAQHQPLDFDSQQRLNEIGLPEPSQALAASSAASSHTLKRASASHLGLSAGLPSVVTRYATTGRNSSSGSQNSGSHRLGPALITGRAMSQQSLTRPTMPLSRRLRRAGGGGGATSAGSGSDVGGSSMSLVSRLKDGSRYENAHTRSPVVMLIPQAPASKQSELSRSEANSRRSSSRLGRSAVKASNLRVSSQDRGRKSATRNGSDSESSSSMLRTLVKPRGSRVGSTNRSSRRRSTATGGGGGARDDSDLEENMDGVGQLATEIDSYKFRRRYSVPKDAKINWFSKLKQRVSTKS